jgi:hypothetical protein
MLSRLLPCDATPSNSSTSNATFTTRPIFASGKANMHSTLEKKATARVSGTHQDARVKAPTAVAAKARAVKSHRMPNTRAPVSPRSNRPFSTVVLYGTVEDRRHVPMKPTR